MVTAAWLRLVPAPEVELPIVGLYADADTGIGAIERVLASGVVPAAIEYLDGVMLQISGDTYPFGLPADAGFMVITEADGAAAEAAPASPVSCGRHSPRTPSPSTLPRPRKRSLRASGAGAGRRIRKSGAARGGAFSEDIAVPLDRLRDVARRTQRIGARHDVPALSFGHAGDGNIHATFLSRPDEPGDGAARGRRVHDLFDLAHLTRRHRLRRARHRLAQARSAPAAARPHRVRPAPAPEAGLRSEGPAQPGQEGLVLPAEQDSAPPPGARGLASAAERAPRPRALPGDGDRTRPPSAARSSVSPRPGRRRCRAT